ncbi:MAG: C40 family peptidase, partial [Verrucomicrobiota bacterium]
SAGAPPGGPVVPPAPLGPQPAARWRQAAQRWMGAPYVLGGTTRNGVDCSAFAQSLHREVVGLNLPRTTREQWEAGRPVSATALRAGDLVFFMTLGTGQASHVGVFLEGEEFVHAGTRTGVTRASFREPYWRERFIGARRFPGGAAPGAGAGGVRR